MSEFFIQEQQLSKNTRTLIKNKQGKELFLMVGCWGTRGDVLSLYTMGGQLVASIKQTSIIFGSRFELYQEFKKVGSIKKILTLPPDFYYIQQLHWTVLGNIATHQYTIYHVNQKVMQMDKTTLFSDNYLSLQVHEDKDAPLCICIAAILDYWLYNKKTDRSKKQTLRYNPCY